MLGLDPRSILLMSGLLTLLMGAMLLLMRRGYPASIHGLQEWAIGLILTFVGTVLASVYGKVPDFITTVFGNALVLYSTALVYAGSQRFLGQPTTHRFWGLLVLACVPVFGWYVFFEPNYLARITVFSLVDVAILLAHARLLFRAGTYNIFTRAGTVILILHAGFLFLRLLAIYQQSDASGVLDPKGLPVLYLTGFALAGQFFAVNLILMASERIRAEFEHVATHDLLTGTLSRGAVIEACEQELERCLRHDRQMAVLMLDIDHFKTINDNHGHLVGDQVLIGFTQRVRQQLRLPDRLGRFGGEEFLLLLAETPPAEAQGVAERILRAVAAPGTLPPCTVSIGIATPGPGKQSLDALIARADSALYQAKANGRNRVEAD